jgi:hypothetical protein
MARAATRGSAQSQSARRRPAGRTNKHKKPKKDRRGKWTRKSSDLPLHDKLGSGVGGFRIYRKETDDNNWESCEDNTTGRKKDSYVHRYGRTIGFGDGCPLSTDSVIRDAYEQTDQRDYRKKSNLQRVDCQADFEIWVLHQYHKMNKFEFESYPLFLDQIMADSPQSGIEIEPPSEGIILAYMWYLRKPVTLNAAFDFRTEQSSMRTTADMLNAY